MQFTCESPAQYLIRLNICINIVILAGGIRLAQANETRQEQVQEGCWNPRHFITNLKFRNTSLKGLLDEARILKTRMQDQAT